MQIRLYRDGDKFHVIQLISRVLNEFGFQYSKRLDRDLADIPKYYFHRNGKFWVVVEEGIVVGTIGVSHINSRVCKLRRFYVSKKYRHKGFGLLLYKKALIFIRRQGYQEVWTSTSSNFKDSIRFQQRAGFKRTQRVLWPYTRSGIFHILKLEKPNRKSD